MQIRVPPKERLSDFHSNGSRHCFRYTKDYSNTFRLFCYIKFPKNETCVEFSADGQYLAVVERRDGKDCLSLFHSAKDWRVARHYELLPDLDTQGVLWSANSDLIAVYSTKLQCSLAVYSLDGRCLFLYRPDDIGNPLIIGF